MIFLDSIHVMKSKASFIHENGAGHTLLHDLVLVWVLGLLCFSTTGFSQQLNQSKPAPGAPDASTQNDSTNLPATTSTTPVPAPGPAPTRGERIKEDWLIGLDMKRVLTRDSAHNYLIGDWANELPPIKFSDFLLCWISSVGSQNWTLAKNGEMKFTHNPLFLQNNEFQELDTSGVWSLSGDILTLKMSEKFVVGKGAVRREENSLVELKISQCEHRFTEDEFQKWKAQYAANGGRLGSFSADDWNNAHKDRFDFYCVNYQSQTKSEYHDVNGKITVSEGYALRDGKGRNLKYNGPPFFIGVAKLQTNSASESVIPAVPGPAVSAIAELARDCEREIVDEGNQGNSSSKDPPIIRRQQIKLSINGRTYTAEVAIHDVDLFYYDVPTQTIHIGVPSNRTYNGGIVRYHRGVLNEMASFITDANDGRFDGSMTDASGQRLSPLATEAFADRLSADYLAYRRSLLASNPTSTPKNPLDRYLAPLEQSDRSLTESLLNPRRPNLSHEPGYAVEQNLLNARADVFTEADRLIREGKLDDALALFKKKGDIVSRTYYCKLLRTYEHYYPEKAQRIQE